jgi:hypothetical protein
MSEWIKSAIYVGVALLVLALALAARFWPSGDSGPASLPKTLFAEFDNPQDARSLEIAHYDEVSNQVNRFRVEQLLGRWVIPSHANYPADAEARMTAAATSLIGLEVLDSATDHEGQHEKYGVLEPNAERLERGSKGVGVLVSLKDGNGAPLAQLIVGKEVDRLEHGRFVRVPGQSRVLVTKLDLSKLSTNFVDWIEKDLLQLDPAEVESVTFHDYSIDEYVEPGTGRRFRQPNQRLRMTVRSGSGGWQLGELMRYNDRKEPVRVPLADTEELNQARLEVLRTALSEMEIVDVRRKPKSLGADLKADKAINLNEQVRASLEEHGFFLVSAGGANPQTTLYSKNGDLTVRTKEGVEYSLRFGDLAVSQNTSELGKLNRYLMVSCHVAEDLFPRPAEPNYPQLPPEPAPPAAAKGAAAAAPAAGGAQDAKPPETPEATDKPGGAPQQPPANAGEPSQPPVDRLQIEAQILRMKNAYEKELAAWREKRKPADDKVRELNARFADWYYVIPEEVYVQIHLGQGELIKEKANVAEAGFGVDAFRLLESMDLGKPSEAPQR